MSGQIMLVFDDGLASHHDAAKRLAAHGMLGTFAVVAGRVGTPGFLTQEQLEDMHGWGHFVCGHSFHHRWSGHGAAKPGVRPWPKDAITEDLLMGRDALNRWGYHGDYCVVPYGTSNLADEAHMQEVVGQLKWLRLTVGGPCEGGWVADGARRLYPQGYGGKVVGISTALDIRWPKAIADWAGWACMADKLAIVCIHSVGHVSGNAMDVKWETFQEAIGVVAGLAETGGLECVTPGDLVGV